MKFEKIASILHSLITGGLGIGFLTLWLSMGAMFSGMILGAITGWASGIVAGVHPHGTAIIGAAGGAIIGLISIPLITLGLVYARKEGKLFGWKLSSLLRMYVPTAILLLFLGIIITIPIHNYLIYELIAPIFSRPPNVPEKQIPLPDGFVNVFHFSDKADDIFALHRNKLLFNYACLTIGILFIFTATLGEIGQKLKDSSSDKWWRCLQGVIGGVLAGIVLVWVVGGIIKSTNESLSLSQQNYQQLQNIFDHRQYQIVEGQVKGLHIYPPGGHAKGDIIVVDNVEFEITPYANEFFYDKPIVQGGIFTEGRYVRIYYHEDRILAIDLKPE